MRVFRMAVGGILLLALLFDIGAMRYRLVSPASAREVATAREIGEMVGHSTKTVFLSDSYGLPLEYHGELSGEPWPIRSDLEWEELAGVAHLTAEQRFESWYSDYSPEYFIVLNLREFEQQRDLQTFLRGSFPIAARSDDYLVFDLRRRVDGR